MIAGIGNFPGVKKGDFFAPNKGPQNKEKSRQ